MKHNEIKNLYIGTFTAVVSLLPLFGCSNDTTPVIEEPPTAATISGSIEGMTRVSEQGFADGDIIGVSCYANEDGSPLLDRDPMGYFTNVPYYCFHVANTSIFESAVFLKEQDFPFEMYGDEPDLENAKPKIYYLIGGTRLFSAYYPWVNFLKDGKTDGVEVKEGVIYLHCDDEDIYKMNGVSNNYTTRLDALVATGVAGNKSVNNGAISFTGDHAFRHVMAQMHLTFKTSGFIYEGIDHDEPGDLILRYVNKTDARDLTGTPRIYIKGINPVAKFDPVVGTASAYGNTIGEIDLFKTNCKPEKSGEGQSSQLDLYFVVPPQTCDMKIIFESHAVGAEGSTTRVYYETPVFRAVFESGKTSHYTVTLRPHDTTVSNEISPWGYGGSTSMTIES